MSHGIHKPFVTLGLALLLVGASAAPAMAAPEFELDLQRQSHETQVFRVHASGGQYRLHFGAGGPGVSETGDIDHEASAAEVEAALNSLANVSASGGSVSVRPSGPFFEVAFNGGALANTDVAKLSAFEGTEPLSGPGSRVVITDLYPAGATRSDERIDYTVRVKNSGDEPTSGNVTVEVALPSEQSATFFNNFLEERGTYGTGWTCKGELAKAVCKRENALGIGASYPLLTIAIELGDDAPDHSLVEATVSGGGATSDSASDEFDFGPAKSFGLEGLDSEVIGEDGEDFTQAGGHPFLGGAHFSAILARSLDQGNPFPVELFRKAVSDLPRGFVGNALAVPELCPSLVDVLESTCPPGSAVGAINVDAVVSGAPLEQTAMPIFAIEPEFGAPAQFAFAELDHLQQVFTLTPRLRPQDGYAISLDASPAATLFPLRRVNDATLCGFGATVIGNDFFGCKSAEDPSANPVPLITNPTRCTGTPPTLKISLDSWQDPGDFKSATSVDPSPTGCEKIDFQPKVSLAPTNNQADSPTGLDVEIEMPTDGLLDPKRESQANLANVEVTLPKGMSVNPAAAHGLGSCTPAQVKLKSNAPHQCPLSSQVGTVEIDTPLIRETLTGHVFMAAQRNNPFNETLGLYMVFESEKDGITIKVAGKVEADPVTGQLTSTFTENPEQPFSRAVIKFNSGPRAPLINPPTCGTYAIHTELSPWSALDPANPTGEEIVSADTPYQVSSGPNGGPCPDNNLEPKLETGLQNPVAGAKSPFVLKLSREDGSRRFTALDLDMPGGLVAYLKGVPYCPDAVLTGISGAELTGRGELASPACPAASQIGTVQAGAGAGPYPFYAPGRVFLAGPYKGGPLSLAVVTPAVAGPFDLGNVVVRNAVYVDPVTAEVNVVSDPIPTILHGLKLAVRDIRVAINRPGFTAAPTSCEPQQVGVRVGGEGGTFVDLANRFQVGECAHLGFRPRTRIQLFGKTNRGAYQGVKAVVRPRPGHANISRTVVRFPRSAFVAQEHIRTICTRVQFAAERCPKGSVYGRAVAYSPLLDMPLRGNVYLRSSDNTLPDAVADLRGPAHQPIKIEVAIRNDSVRGALRNTVLAAPDAPVSYFRLQMFGKQKGLIVNSRNVCRGKNNATVVMKGHSGKRSLDRTRVFNRRCKKQRRAKRGAHRSKLRMLRASRAPGLSR
jgi:hypothetical protein